MYFKISIEPTLFERRMSEFVGDGKKIRTSNQGIYFKALNFLFMLSHKLAQCFALPYSSKKVRRNLAHQCPFTDGAIIYDARALYNLVNQKVIVYNDTYCAQIGFSFKPSADSNSVAEQELHASLLSNEKINKDKFSRFEINYYLFPNPAQNEVNIRSLICNENVFIKITDAAGKVLLEKELLISNYLAKVDLNLLNGIYFVEIINKNKKHEFKKLIISK